MICILPIGSRFDQGFYSPYAESDTLLLFSSFYGVQDVGIFESYSEGCSSEFYVFKRFLSKSQYKKAVGKLRSPRQVNG